MAIEVMSELDKSPPMSDQEKLSLNATLKLKPKITHISNKGEVTVRFNRGMRIPANFTYVLNESLAIYVASIGSSMNKDLSINYTITDFKDSTMII